MIMKIVSGGQTGVDRAALDMAIELNIPHGGWCPNGRLAELDTTIPERYSLQETLSTDVSVRTKLNIRDSDATLLIVPQYPLTVNDGTVLTLQELHKKNKTYFIIDLSKALNTSTVITWVQKNSIHVLNVAGPRESQAPGIYAHSLSCSCHR